MRQNDDSEDVQQTGEVEDEDEVNDDSEDVQQMPAFSVCASSSAADKDRPPHPIAVQWSHQLTVVSSKTDRATHLLIFTPGLVKYWGRSLPQQHATNRQK